MIPDLTQYRDFFKRLSRLHKPEVVEQLSNYPNIFVSSDNLAKIGQAKGLFDEIESTYDLVNNFPFKHFIFSSDFEDDVFVFFVREDECTKDEIVISVSLMPSNNDVSPFTHVMFSSTLKISLKEGVKIRIDSDMSEFLNVKTHDFGILVELISDKLKPRHKEILDDHNEQWDLMSEAYKKRSTAPQESVDTIEALLYAIRRAFLISIGYFSYVEAKDLYPFKVEAKQAQAKKKKKKNKVKGKLQFWQKKDIPTIIYWDTLPSESSQKEHTSSHGGDSTRTVSPHNRKGHWRKLTHEKYKNHPKYGSRIRVKPTWIGEKKGIFRGQVYTLLED